MSYELEEILEIIGVFLSASLLFAVGIGILLGVISIPVYFSEKAVCKVYSEDLDTSFGFWQGCMVKDPKSGIWLSSSDIESINGTVQLIDKE